METYTIILRLFHIFSGIFWVGTTFYTVFFLEPAVRAAGAAGAAVLGRLMMTSFPLMISLSSVFTVLAGFLLYLADSHGLQASWIVSPPGIMLTIGGSAGILAFLNSAIFQMPVTIRMKAIQNEMQAAGTPPTPAQQAELQQLARQMRLSTRVGAGLMIIAVIGMATARELGDF